MMIWIATHGSPRNRGVHSSSVTQLRAKSKGEPIRNREVSRPLSC
jgi:hypothetical protein